MNTMRYVIFNESSEFSKRYVKGYESIIDAYVSNGLQNGSFTVIAEFDNYKEAKKELEKYRCTVNEYKTAVSIFDADVYYIEEQELNEYTGEYEPTGDYDFAEMVEELEEVE
ncbi:MAG: hypothetical protein E7480_08325 [Ruminococcaceae bacterium]|nr:hypothetical protein [Oscillospiraceae bacterium]